MQLYLLGYASISDEGKIIAVLSLERKTMIKDCPICKKKLATKKPGQKHLFGCAVHQENIGADGSPAEESNKGDTDKEAEDEAKEDSHFGKRDK